MKVGYTPGSLYQRHKAMGYTPGSQYKRFKQSNMQRMNKQAMESYHAEVASGGTRMFDAIATKNHGLSELAAMQVMKRAQEQMNALAEKGENLNLANIIDDSNDSDDATGAVVDETV